MDLFMAGFLEAVMGIGDAGLGLGCALAGCDNAASWLKQQIITSKKRAQQAWSP
jgi:hypothetical protein